MGTKIILSLIFFERATARHAAKRSCKARWYDKMRMRSRVSDGSRGQGEAKLEERCTI